MGVSKREKGFFSRPKLAIFSSDLRLLPCRWETPGVHHSSPVTVPSGKRLHNYRTPQFNIGKLYCVFFHSYVSHYQRVTLVHQQDS